MSKMNRRELLVTSVRAAVGGAVGGAGVILLNACRGGSSGLSAGSDAGPCPLNPEQEEGPFYVDEGLLRSDVLDGQTGVPLLVSIKVLKAAKCEPVTTAAVEIWSANSLGKYSDKTQEGTVVENIYAEFRSATLRVPLSLKRSTRVGTRGEPATFILRSATAARPQALLTPVPGAFQPLAGRSSFLPT